MKASKFSDAQKAFILSIGSQKGPRIGVQKGPPLEHSGQPPPACGAEGGARRRSAAAEADYALFSKRQLSLPVSTMSQ